MKKVRALKWYSDFHPTEKVEDTFTSDDYYLLVYSGFAAHKINISEEYGLIHTLEEQSPYSRCWMLVPKRATLLGLCGGATAVPVSDNEDEDFDIYKYLIDTNMESFLYGTIYDDQLNEVFYNYPENLERDTQEEVDDFLGSMQWILPLPTSMTDDEIDEHKNDLHPTKEAKKKVSKAIAELGSTGWTSDTYFSNRFENVETGYHMDIHCEGRDVAIFKNNSRVKLSYKEVKAIYDRMTEIKKETKERRG